jgi:hypothetical protein
MTSGSYHDRPARERYDKMECDRCLCLWQDYLAGKLPGYEEGRIIQETESAWILHAIRWCKYFTGKRDRMP